MTILKTVTSMDAFDEEDDFHEDFAESSFAGIEQDVDSNESNFDFVMG